MTGRLRRLARTILATVVAVLVVGVGTVSAHAAEGPPDPAGPVDGMQPGPTAALVGASLAALIVGVALGLAVRRRVPPEVDHPEPGAVTGRRAAACPASRAAASPARPRAARIAGRAPRRGTRSTGRPRVRR